MAPLEGALEEILGITTKTTSNSGRYSHPMREGAYTIRASAPQYTTGWRQAGVPAGVFNYVTGPGSTVGQELVDSPDVAGFVVTGSRDVGIGADVDVTAVLESTNTSGNTWRFFAETGVALESAPLYAHALVGMVVHVGRWWSEVRTPDKDTVARHLTALVYYGLERLPREPTRLHLASQGT